MTENEIITHIKKRAIKAIKSDVHVALAMCIDTADKEAVDRDWVIETFKKEFEKLVEEGNRK